MGDLLLFVVDNHPLNSLRFQQQLRAIGQHLVETYLSGEELEANLYKLPDVVLLNDSLGEQDLVHLTNVTTKYDRSIKPIWLCSPDNERIKALAKVSTAFGCFEKGNLLIEQLSFLLIEATKDKGVEHKLRRREFLKKHFISEDKVE